MKKYGVTLIYSATKYVEVEAEDEDKALEEAYKNWHVSLCHQCAGEIDVGDCYDAEVTEITE